MTRKTENKELKQAKGLLGMTHTGRQKVWHHCEWH